MRAEDDGSRGPVGPGALIYHAVFEESHHPTWILSADGALLAANRRARSLMGSGESWLGREAAALAFPRATPASRAALALAVEGPEEGPPPRIHVEDTDAAGRRRSHEVTVRPAGREKGEPLFLILEARDVSDLRRVSGEAHAARLAAEAADRAKSAFLARMSHEMRTPLHAVLGFTRLLLDSARPEELEARDALRQIEEAGGRLLALVDDVLELARLESGGLTADATPTDLPRLLDELASTHAEAAAAKGLDFRFEADDELPVWVLIDAARARRALGDLLDNAVRYTAAGGVVLTASWAPEGRRDRIALAVEDTGPGIPPSELPRLLSPFESGHRSRTGTGLGLALARRLVQLLDGDFRFGQGRGGVGTRIEIELPAPAVEAVLAASEREEPRAARRPTPAAVSPASLPAELRAELDAAARIADSSRLRAAIARAIELEPRLAEPLRSALDRFDYRGLIGWLQLQPAATSSSALVGRDAKGADERNSTRSATGLGREKR